MEMIVNANKKTDLRLDSELKEIKGDSTGRVHSIITRKGEEISCEFVSLTVGISPNKQSSKGLNLIKSHL